MNNHEKIWLSILKKGEMTPNELYILDDKKCHSFFSGFKLF